MTQDDSFRAKYVCDGALSGDGNLIAYVMSMWGTSDAGKALIELEMGGAPHRMPLTYWQQSPVAHGTSAERRHC